MNEVKFDIKTVITIITAAIVFGGFYYTTQHRLDQLEGTIEDLELQLKGLIIHNPLLQKVEQDTLASFSNEDDEDGKL